jgi:hypothetical protein
MRNTSTSGFGLGQDLTWWATLASPWDHHITAQPASWDLIGSVLAKAKLRVPKLWSCGPAWRIFVHVLALGSPQGPTRRALTGNLAAGVDLLPQLRHSATR